MKKGLIILVLNIIIMNLLIINSFAEELEDSLFILQDGTSIYGKMVEKKDDFMIIETANFGKINIKLEKIKEIKFKSKSNNNFFENFNFLKKDENKKIVNSEEKNIPKENDKKEFFKNPTETRLLFAPTAKMLKQGKGYIQDSEVILLSGNFGITDNISIGALGTIIPFISAQYQIYGITPKMGIDITKDISVALGLLQTYVPIGNSHNSIGYLLGTYGSSDINITLGVGNRIGSSDTAIMIGGLYRLNNNLALVSENYFTTIRDIKFLPSFGVRFFGENLSTDLALVLANSSNTFFPLPYVNFVYSF